MGLVTPLVEPAAPPSESTDVRDAETLFALWETSRAAAERLLPAPLRPVKRPIALAMVGTYPRTSVGPVYREAALALRAEAFGTEGFYFLPTPVTDNMALVYGRESPAYPKKIADIAFVRNGRQVVSWVQRHDIRLLSVQAQLTGHAGPPHVESVLDEMFDSATGSAVLSAYSVQHILAPNLDGLDYPPRLVHDELEYRPRIVDRGPATVALRHSDYDPWSEVEVVRALGAVYMLGASSARAGHVIAEVGPRPLASYGRLRVDLR